MSCESRGCNSCGSAENGQTLIGVPQGDSVNWHQGKLPSLNERELQASDRIAQTMDPSALKVANQAAQEQMGRIYSVIEERKIPFWAHLDLTYHCNTDCIHCYCQHMDDSFGGKYNNKDLSTREAFDLLDQLADAGALHLTLSGGELFVRKDFFDIAFYASREKHFALKLFTNGTIMTAKMVDRLVKLAPTVIEISLQGATAEVHDAIVQMPGAYDRVVRSVKMLRERGINVVLKSTIMQPNYHQADDMVRLAKQLDTQGYRTTLEVTPKNDGDRSVTRFQIDDQAIFDYLRSDFPVPPEYKEPVSPEEAREKSTCGTGTVACYISPYGDVYPCIQLLISMGNIREQPFKEIWYADSELRRQLDQIQQYGDLPECSTCEYVQYCQRCHGLAYLESGDLTSCHKMAIKVAKISKQVNDEINPKSQKQRLTGGVHV